MTMKPLTVHQRKILFFINDIILFLIGCGILLAGVIVEPTDQLLFLRAELGRIFIIHKHISAFGFFTILISLFGIYGFWSRSGTFYVRYGSAILLVLFYEIVIIARYLIPQRIQPWYINAEILEIAGSASFSQFSNYSNGSNVLKSFFSEALENMENLRNLHAFFECCSGFKFNSWKPLTPNYICCKQNVPIPCSLEDSYKDKCYQNLLIYAWKLYRYYVLICGLGFLLQSAVLSVAVILSHWEMDQDQNNDE